MAVCGSIQVSENEAIYLVQVSLLVFSLIDSLLFISLSHIRHSHFLSFACLLTLISLSSLPSSGVLTLLFTLCFCKLMFHLPSLIQSAVLSPSPPHPFLLLFSSEYHFAPVEDLDQTLQPPSQKI